MEFFFQKSRKKNLFSNYFFKKSKKESFFKFFFRKVKKRIFFQILFSEKRKKILFSKIFFQKRLRKEKNYQKFFSQIRGFEMAGTDHFWSDSSSAERKIFFVFICSLCYPDQRYSKTFFSITKFKMDYFLARINYFTDRRIGPNF